MKNILIVTQSFAPRNSVAAIRFTKVVKYLSRTGNYNFFVITETAPLGEPIDSMLLSDIDSVKEHVSVYAIDNQRLGKKLKPKSSRGTNSGTSDGCRFWTPGESVTLKNRIRGRYFFHYQTQFRDRALKKAESIIRDKNIEAMITSYGGIGATAAGVRIKKKHPEIRWINDYRDPIRAKTPGITKVSYKIAEKADTLCEVITGASTSHVGSNTHPEKFNVITNSCDFDEIYNIPPCLSNKFQFCFTGTFYPGKFEAETFCKMISELINEGEIDRENVVVKLAGKSIGVITKTASSYGIDDIVEEVGFVPRKDSIAIQKGSDILCVFLWNESGSKDVLPGKIMEYTMMDRPIVCFIRGDKGDSIVRQIILNNNLGECYEEVTKELDYSRVKNYILALYKERIEKGVIVRNNSGEIKNKFSAKTMAENFERLL